MNRFHLTHRQGVLRLVTLLGLITCGLFVTTATLGQEPSASRPLILDGFTAPTQGSAQVRGKSFTPGGAVYVVLYDQWGMELHETRWVTASDTTFGSNGSRDPANGYARGGTIEEVLGTIKPVFGVNGSQDPANGYVHGSDDSIVMGASEPVFGLNGSQDPASGYLRGNPGHAVARNLCGAEVMVRAYDAQNAAWSNVLDIDPGC
jgi:hypothetical protein